MGPKWTPVFPCFNDSDNPAIHLFHCSKLEINVTTCMPIQTPDQIYSIQLVCEAADAILIAGFWFSVVSGIVGNGLAIVTISSLPTSPATFYVGLLATSDLVAICIQVVVQFLEKYKMTNRLNSSWQLSNMLCDISASYSNWLLVLICLERYFTVRFPLHKRYYFTLAHSRISAVVLAVLIVTLYNTATWVIGYTNPNMFKIRNLVYAVLPLALILVIISLISYQLRKIHLDRKALNGRVHSRMGLSSTDDQQQSSTGIIMANKTFGASPLQEIARLENSITAMMLVAAVCFSVLTLPYCVLLYTYVEATVSMNTPVLRARWYLLHNISRVLYFLNLSVNFLLYFLSAKKFRTQLFKVVCLRLRTLSSSNTHHRQHQHSSGLENNSKLGTSHLGPNGDYLTFRPPSDVSQVQTDYNASSESVGDGLHLSLVETSTLNGHSEIDAVSREIYESYPVLRVDFYGDMMAKV